MKYIKLCLVLISIMFFTYCSTEINSTAPGTAGGNTTDILESHFTDPIVYSYIMDRTINPYVTTYENTNALTLSISTSLGGIERFTNLEYLFIDVTYCESNCNTYLSPIAELSDLEYLGITQSEGIVLTPIRSLANLNRLSVSQSKIVDISAITGLTSLTELDLTYNNINSIAGLENLVNLRTLLLQGNYISDISNLNTLVNLYELRLGGYDGIPSSHGISDLSPLASCSSLWRLMLYYTSVQNFEFAASLDSMQLFGVIGNYANTNFYFGNNNSITSFGCVYCNMNDLSGLNASRLEQVRTFTITSSPVSHVGSYDMPEVTRFGVANSNVTSLENFNASNMNNLEYLYFQDNEITILPYLSEFTALEYVYLMNNNITDFSNLMVQSNINYVWIAGNDAVSCSHLQALIDYSDSNTNFTLDVTSTNQGVNCQ